jgi:hypothetical protein
VRIARKRSRGDPRPVLVHQDGTQQVGDFGAGSRSVRLWQRIEKILGESVEPSFDAVGKAVGRGTIAISSTANLAASSFLR